MTRDLKPSTYAYTHTYTHSQNAHAHRHTHQISLGKNERGFREVVRAANESGRSELQEFPECVPSVLTHQRFGNEEALSLSNEICHFE